MNEEEVAALIAQKMAELEARHNAEIEGLKTTNAKLLTEKQNAKAATEAAEREKLEKKGDVESLKTLHANEMQRLTAQIEERDNKLKTYLIDNNIATVLAKSNVHESAIDVLTSHFKGRASIIEDRAVIDNLPLETAISDYLGQEGNRIFVRAPANGGLSTTGSTDAKGHQWTKAPATGTELNQWDRFADANPAAANALADSWRRSDLKS